MNSKIQNFGMEVCMQKRTKSRFRLAALFIVIGMLLELVSFWWVGPSAFMLFIGGGVLFSVVGIGLYLFILLTANRHKSEPEITQS